MRFVLPDFRSRKTRATLAIVVLCAAGTAVIVTPARDLRMIGSALADPLSVLSDRSPGARGAGALTQTKPANSGSSLTSSEPGDGGHGATERVLANVRARPPAVGIPASSALPGTETLSSLGSPAAAAATPGEGGVPFASGGPGGVPALGGFTPTSTGGGGGGPGGGGPGGGGESSGGTSSGGVVTPPGVPEPATWIALMLGFFAIGGALRYRSVGLRDKAGASSDAI